MAESPQFQVVRVYTKDVSFESPQAPEVFLKADIKPSIKLQINNTTTKLNNEIFEVSLHVNVTAESEEKTLYIVEYVQAGVFRIEGFDSQTQSMLLGSYCPSTLFPFARQGVAEQVNHGGFPQLLLDPINFDALYQQHVAEAAEKAKNDGSNEQVSE